ncbi:MULTISPECIES: hypothetical protein [Microbacterium]|uniref:hypothetical protein n=1 Tax=Microbacterium TaxID=33882 RepID=UPI001357D581|nr:MULTISPECIES: hypothetical protein [Microbacterium]
MAAARLGYVSVRPLAADILSDPVGTREALREVLDVLGPKFTGVHGSQRRRNRRQTVL